MRTLNEKVVLLYKSSNVEAADIMLDDFSILSGYHTRALNFREER